MTNILLLTGTIAPTKVIGKSSSELNIEGRELSYIKALTYYITQSDFDSIVFGENSNYPFAIRKQLEQLAEKFNKKIELIQCKGNPVYPEKYGYGCGEAEIIQKVIEQSKIIKKNNFFKITGRYIIENINEIIKQLQYQENYFHKQGIFASPLGVSTAFFKISVKTYNKYLYQKDINFFETFFQKNINLNKITKYPYLSVELVRYILLRPYLLNSYTQQNKTKILLKYLFPKIDNYGRGKYIRNIAYKMYVKVGLGEFNNIHKIIDSLQFNRKYSKIRHPLKEFFIA